MSNQNTTSNSNETMEALRTRVTSLEALLKTAQDTGKTFETEALNLRAELERTKKLLEKAQVPTTFLGRMKKNWSYILGGVGVGAAAGAGAMYYATCNNNSNDSGMSES